VSKKVGIVDTSLRDTHQALVSPRLETREILPIAARLDAVGYAAVEVWGGATFDICLRWAREDPWERLRALRRVLVRTPLRTILRGPYLLGYHPYPPDVQEAFLRTAVEIGLKSFRIYDALNDVRNIEPIIGRARAAGGEVWGTLIYTRSPHHNHDVFVSLAADLARAGVVGISVADVAGLLTPAVARLLVKGIKDKTGLPVHLHCRSATAMAAMAYVAAAEEGVEALDCPLAPLSLFAAQPAAETVWAALSDLGIETGLDRGLLQEASRAAEKVAVRHVAEQAERSLYELSFVVRQIPGGMVSNVIGLLKENNALDRLDEVLDEVVKVREEFGWPPLVTPVTQLVGAQAVFNVLLGARYATVPREVEEYFLGRYGRPPGPVSDEVAAKVRAGRPTAEGPAGEDLPPALDRARDDLAREGLLARHEDAITYAIFPQTALAFFRYRRDPSAVAEIPQEAPVRGAEDAAEVERLVAFMDARGLAEVEVEEGEVRYAVRRPAGAVAPAAWAPSSAPVVAPPAEDEARCRQIPSPMAGTFYRSSSPEAPAFVDVGSTVTPETVVCLVEAMKLFNEIKAGVSGVVRKVAAQNGQAVAPGQALFLVE
jgi:oxaloacetate decarboxylase alpha subunit